MSISLRKLRRPHTIVCVLCLMDSEVGSPDSVMDHSLSVVPLLEVVTSVLLVGRVDFRRKDHLVHEFSLLEALLDKKIVLLVHGSVTALARPLENLESASQANYSLINYYLFRLNFSFFSF
mgnify:CR=1 FL=1